MEDMIRGENNQRIVLCNKDVNVKNMSREVKDGSQCYTDVLNNNNQFIFVGSKKRKTLIFRATSGNETRDSSFNYLVLEKEHFLNSL